MCRAKPDKTRPSNTEIEQYLPKCDLMQEQGAEAVWENEERGKAAKTRPSNVEIEEIQPKCDH